MVAAYSIVDVTVAVTDPNNRTVGIRKYPAQICVNDKVNRIKYFIRNFAEIKTCNFLLLYSVCERELLRNCICIRLFADLHRLSVAQRNDRR